MVAGVGLVITMAVPLFSVGDVDVDAVLGAIRACLLYTSDAADEHRDV